MPRRKTQPRHLPTPPAPIEPTVQRQQWAANTRYLVHCPCGSVQLVLFPPERPYRPCGQADSDPKVFALIECLWVLSPYRRRGVAAMLMDTAERIAADQGQPCVWLEWDERDTPDEILQWYLRRGYDDRVFGLHYALMRKIVGTRHAASDQPKPVGSAPSLRSKKLLTTPNFPN